MVDVTDRTRRPTLLDRIVVNPSNYWSSMAVDALTSACFLGIGLFRLSESWRVGAVAFLVGWVVWSFAEYSLHRWLLHGPRSGARRGHTRHHMDEKALVASPAGTVTVVEVALWFLLRPVLGDLAAAMFLGGTSLGYLYYTLLHHADHHWELSLPPVVDLRRRHDIHHAQPNVNYGSTTSFWDRVFGTYKDPGPAT